MDHVDDAARVGDPGVLELLAVVDDAHLGVVGDEVGGGLVHDDVAGAGGAADHEQVALGGVPGAVELAVLERHGRHQRDAGPYERLGLCKRPKPRDEALETEPCCVGGVERSVAGPVVAVVEDVACGVVHLRVTGGSTHAVSAEDGPVPQKLNTIDVEVGEHQASSPLSHCG